MWNSAQFTNGITNGAAWYVVQGGMQDWFYRFMTCNEVTIELSDTPNPTPASLLPALWDDNRPAMLAFLEAVHIGVHGLVTDAVAGAPLAAKVTVAGNTQSVFTDEQVGDYYRMLLPGTYTLTCSAPGYVTRTIRNVPVAAEGPTQLDVPLHSPDIDGDGDVDASDIQFVIRAILGLPVNYDCDLDRDGKVTAADLQLLINYILTH